MYIYVAIGNVNPHHYQSNIFLDTIDLCDYPLSTMNPVYFKLIKAVFLVCLVLLVDLVCAKEVVRCIQKERQSLLQFKAGLTDHFGMLSSWTTADCCQWEGIHCDNLTGHVLMLDLHGHNEQYRESVEDDDLIFYLSGKIHKSLMQLQHLNYLNLSWNSFEDSSIPDFFASLSNLRYLDLSHSKFVGKIPNQLGSLPHLKWLDLGWNRLEASIPYQLGSLSKLQYLDLSYNYFGGKIPTQFGSLPHLRYLNLRGNHLEGSIPYQFGNLFKLQHLDLMENYLEGNIPSQLGNLSSLQFLDLRGNSLRGNTPSQLGKLSNLQKLYLGGYGGTLKIDDENHSGGRWLSNLTSLSHFYLQSISDLDRAHSWLQMIGKLQKLRELSLSYCSLSDHFILSLGPSRFNFSTSLSVLDLSWNSFTSPSMIFHWVSHFSSNLVELDLSGNLMVAPQSNQFAARMMISKLPKLRVLKLSDCSLLDDFLALETASKFNLSTSLFVLDLSGNSFTSSSMIFQWVSNISSNLFELDLRYNLLEAPPASSNDHFGSIVTTNSLKRLDLSNNRLKGGALKSFMNICTLRALNMNENNLTEDLPSILHNLSCGCVRNSMQELDLSYNKITGSLPDDLSMFSSLKTLDLSYNQLSGKMAEGINLPIQLESLSIRSNSFEGGIPKSFGNACALRLLDMSNNSFCQELPVIIHHLSSRCARHSLQVLDLSMNQINGTLGDLSIFSSLKRLNLSENKLNGKIPEDIRFPSQLKELLMGSNSLDGVISDSNFANMSKLESLELSDNSLALTFTQNWVAPFQLRNIGLRSCKLGVAFPKWLQTQDNFKTLDISNAGISDNVPKWFWDKLALREGASINISYNNLKGIIPNCPLKNTYSSLFLASNQFEGPIPPFLRGALMLDLSKNKFSDSLWFVCMNGTVETLSQLDLSNNKLYGQIPNCWIHFKSLAYLDLSHNNFFGMIPTSVGSLVELQALLLRNNSLTKEIPFSLMNCTKLVMLDVGENGLSGLIPSWIGMELQELQVLSLGRNQFFGNLPLELCYLRGIQLLDLSLNNLSGWIPKCFNNFTSMAQKASSEDFSNHNYFFQGRDIFGNQSYELSAFLMWKGVQQVFKNNELLLLKSIDLSSNHFSEEIPREIESLFELVSLNLSRNNLSGKIPSNIGKLASLEFLDLSRNQLIGSIPSSLAQIDRLAALDLSHNHLSGEIPTSTQLQSFNASSFEDNLDLCGLPLEKLCIEGEPPHETMVKIQQDDEDLLITRGFHISMAFGFVIGFWGTFGSILVKRSWRHAYFNFLNNANDSIYVMVAVKFAMFKRWLKD